MMKDAIEQRSSFNLTRYETAFKVDIFICKSYAFDRMQLAWYRMGGEVSDRQWRDVLGVLKVGTGALDYLRKWAGDLNVTDLLERVLKEPASPPSSLRTTPLQDRCLPCLQPIHRP